MLLRYRIDTNIVIYVLTRRPLELLSVLNANASRTAIGVNDLHIAAHARSEGRGLVTNTLAKFERVPALEVENEVADYR